MLVPVAARCEEKAFIASKLRMWVRISFRARVFFSSFCGRGQGGFKDCRNTEEEKRRRTSISYINLLCYIQFSVCKF
jgi:hypothetical protein